MPASLYIFPYLQHGTAADDEVIKLTSLSQKAADVYMRQPLLL